jgi:Tfp pilus assembly protein PilO
MSKNRLFLVVVVALGIVYALFVAPVADQRAALAERLEATYDSLIKHEQFVRRTKETGLELDKARKELQEMEQFIVQAEDVSLGFAQLQSKIQDIAEDAGLNVRSIKPLPSVMYAGYRGLPIFLDATGDIRQLSRFLNHLDSTWEFISVDSLNITATRQQTLRVRLQLSGLMKS